MTDLDSQRQDSVDTICAFIGLPAPPPRCTSDERARLKLLRNEAFTAHCEAGQIEKQAQKARSKARQLIQKYAAEYRKVLGEAQLFDPNSIEDE